MGWCLFLTAQAQAQARRVAGCRGCRLGSCAGLQAGGRGRVGLQGCRVAGWEGRISPPQLVRGGEELAQLPQQSNALGQRLEPILAHVEHAQGLVRARARVRVRVGVGCWG